MERVEKNAKWGLIGRRIGRTQRGEVEWRRCSEDQREKGIKRTSENRLKKGQQQRESELRLKRKRRFPKTKT